MFRGSPSIGEFSLSSLFFNLFLYIGQTLEELWRGMKRDKTVETIQKQRFFDSRFRFRLRIVCYQAQKIRLDSATRVLCASLLRFCSSVCFDRFTRRIDGVVELDPRERVKMHVVKPQSRSARRSPFEKQSECRSETSFAKDVTEPFSSRMNSGFD